MGSANLSLPLPKFIGYASPADIILGYLDSALNPKLDQATLLKLGAELIPIVAPTNPLCFNRFRSWSRSI